MDENSFKEKHSKTSLGNRWHRIERKYNNSIHHGPRSSSTSVICRNILNSKTYVREHQKKRLMGDDTERWCLDPNLVMDLRHEKVTKLIAIRLFTRRCKIDYLIGKMHRLNVEKILNQLKSPRLRQFI